jgi:type III pantothenate kinase
MRSAVEEVAGGRAIDRCIAASVVPDATQPWVRCLESRCTKVLWVDHKTSIGLTLSVPRPETIGADRLANAAGAVARYGAPVIVIDFGTALTFSVVSDTRGFIGGAIAPGLTLMTDYLAERTALLPVVPSAPIQRAVGRSTEEAIRIGAEYGFPGMVRGILDHLMQPFDSSNVRVVATGGDAARFVKRLDPSIITDRNLTLLGLGRIGDLDGE